MLADVPDGAECYREEIFGPVVTVETFTEADDYSRTKHVMYSVAR